MTYKKPVLEVARRALQEKLQSRLKAKHDVKASAKTREAIEREHEIKWLINGSDLLRISHESREIFGEYLSTHKEFGTFIIKLVIDALKGVVENHKHTDSVEHERVKKLYEEKCDHVNELLITNGKMRLKLSELTKGKSEL